jgi:diadenosine tetraphosphate (Ap4A) HIT family hydrolase
VHAYGSALEGWLVLVTRRHVAVLADLSDDEAAELGPLLQRVSRALRDTTGCPKTYVAQFAEDPLHQHVHVHVIPRHADQSPDLKSYRIFSLLGGDQPEISEAQRNDIADRLAEHLGRTA